MKKKLPAASESHPRGSILCRLLIVTITVLFSVIQTAEAQVNVTATLGISTGSYSTLHEAFAAINTGRHQGNIQISVLTNLDEGNTPAVLLSRDADPCSYLSITIRPDADNISITGTPGAGHGVIELNGADYVTINGDNPNTAGTNRNLSIINNDDPSVISGSCIRIATSSVVASADNNSIINCNLLGNVSSGNSSSILNAGTSSDASFGIYIGGNASGTALGNPLAITSAMQPAPATSSIKNTVIQNNSINQCGRAIMFNAANSAVSNSLTISVNDIGSTASLGAYPYSSPASTVYRSGIWVAGTNALNISQNNIKNIISYLKLSLAAIELDANIGSGTVSISGNNIIGVANNTVGSAYAANGILVNSAGAAFSISGNNISKIENQAGGQPAAGININSTGGIATITENKIFTVNNHGNGGSAGGIILTTAASGALISNNFIGDILNVYSFGVAKGATGIGLFSGSSHRVYYNSVYLYGASVATGSNIISCFSVANNAQTNLDVRNNIFVNKVTGGAANNAHVCLFLPFASASALNFQLNNNAYFTGATTGVSGVAYAGSFVYNVVNLFPGSGFDPATTTGAGNFRGYSSALGYPGNDLSSFASTGASPFMSGTNLHITPATTPIESGAAVVSVVKDIDNETRNNQYPDMGADEFSGTASDITGPLISYTPLNNTCATGTRQLTATITDFSGIPSANLPVLYWNVNGGAFTAVTGTSIGGDQYQFGFGNGVAVGDVINYYIVAQDVPGNASVWPPVGASGFSISPPAVSTAPISASSYTIQTTLAAGTYDVGTGQTYTTITDAVNAYNNSCPNGPIVFRLMDATYPDETYPITISNPYASSVNTLTILPNTGNAVTVTGNSASAIFKLDGADYITIDGLNTDGSSLTLQNTHSQGAVIWLASKSAGNGATNNTIQNTTLRAGSNSTSRAVIFSGSTSGLGASALAANSNNSYIGNNLYGAIDGIYEFGPTGSGNSNITITGNQFGSTAINADKLGGIGIEVRYVNNLTISGNIISGITSPSRNLTGIGIYNLVTNAVISENKISDFAQTGSSYGAYGIELRSQAGSSNIRVSNNFIWGIGSVGSVTPSNNSFGILVSVGGGYSIWNNSVLMSISPTEPMAIQAPLRISETATVINGIDVRNNIFSNTAATGIRYAVYCQAASNVFSNIDYNIYYSNSSSILNYLGSPKANLFEWQTATGKDVNSMVADPKFISTTNLHLNSTSPANAMAFSIPGLINDIDGDSRVSPSDIGADEMDATDCIGRPATGTVTASSTSLCNGGAVSITVSGYGVGDNLVYQWESGPTSTGPFTDVAGATVPSNFSVPFLATSTSYRLKIFCPLSGQTSYTSPAVTITVNAPVVTSVTPKSRCGSGTVTLSATTVTSGATLKWYDAASGGTALATGPNFVTPVLNSTTTYYVGSSLGNSSGTVGPVSPTAHGGNIGTQVVPWDVYFDVLQPTTLESVDVYPMVSGSAGKIFIKDPAGATVLTVNFTTNVSGGETAQTIPLNYALAIGSGYIITSQIPSGGYRRNESGSVYPYSSSGIKITGNSFSNAYFMGFYNWKFTTLCESVRTAVTATVTTAPSINISASQTSICAGETTVLTASSSNAGYSYIWTPGNIPGITTGVAPASTTTYTVRGTDASGGANNGCSNTKTISISVRPVPAAVTVTPTSGSVCSSGPALQLSASGGLIANVTAFNENFNGTNPNWVLVNNSTGGLPSNAAWTQRPDGYIYQGQAFHSNDGTKFYLTNSIAQGSGTTTKTTLTSSVIDLSGYSTATLSYFHHLNYSGGETVVVEASLDGATWNPIPGGTYTGSVGTPGNFVNTALNLDAYAGAAFVYIRFRYEANWNGWWAIDNVKITGTMENRYTWAQNPAAPNTLFTDADATIPYVPGNPASNVYVLPSVTTQYSLSSSGPAPSNCSSTAVSTINITPPPTVTISNSGNPFCPGTNVFFTATAVNAGPNPTYTWKVNGAIVSTAGSTYMFVSPNEGDRVKVEVISNGTCSNGLPVSSEEDTMHISSFVPVTITVTADPGIEVCEGTPVTFTANVTNAGTNPVYQWKINGGVVGTNSPTFSYVPNYLTNNGDAVTCTVTSNSACIFGPATVTSALILMTVHDMGNVGASVGTSFMNNTVCTGTEVTVVATPVHPGDNPSFLFYINNIPQTPQSSNNFVFTPNNGDKVKVRLTSNYACLNNPAANQATSNTITLQVLDVEPVSVDLDHTNALCSNVPIVFTALPENGGANPVYDFYLGGSVVQSGPSPTYTLVAPATGDEVYVQLTSNRACITDNPAVSAPYNISLTAGPTVSVAATCTSLLAGAGQFSELTATATSGGGTIETYQWYLAPATPVGTNSPTYITNVPGSYYVVVTNSNGCSNSNQATPIIITSVTSPLAGGVYYIPGTGCTGFLTIASAVDYINNYGVGGAVTFAIAPGYTETAPEGGYNITATGTALKTITFDRDGAGANPVITASTQFTAKNNDGIFKIIGGDYITIRNLTLQENPANTAMTPGPTNTMTEWGIALLYATATNGPSHNTIENNTITLNKNYPNSIGIYSNMLHDSVSVETPAAMTNNSGGFNKIYGNNISDVNLPIVFIGAPGNNMPSGNEIGGNAGGSGNELTNWGTNTAPNPGNQFYGVPHSRQGVLAINQVNLNVGWNQIENSTGINAGTNGLFGIKTDFVTAGPVASFSHTISNNTIRLSSTATQDNEPVINICAANTINASAVTGSALHVNGNATATTLATDPNTVSLVNISNFYPYDTASFEGNNFAGNVAPYKFGGYTGIQNNANVRKVFQANSNRFGNADVSTLLVSSNNTNSEQTPMQAVSVLQLDPLATINVNGNSFGYFDIGTHNIYVDIKMIDIPVAAAGLQVNNNRFSSLNMVTHNTSNGIMISSPVPGPSKVISNNVFDSIYFRGKLFLVQMAGGANCFISGNQIGHGVDDDFVTGGFIAFDVSNTPTGLLTISNNIVSGIKNNNSTNTSTSFVRSVDAKVDINHNLFRNLNSHTENGTVLAILIQNSDADISYNEIDSLTGYGTSNSKAIAIWAYRLGNIKIFKNKIHTLTVPNSYNGWHSVMGIFLGNLNSAVVSNNFISDLQAPKISYTGADHNCVVGISMDSLLASANYRLYYNSIYLNASSTGANFGSAGIYHSSSSTSSTTLLDIRNNIIDNESVATGTGLTVALARSGVDLDNYSPASNHNVFYAGTSGNPGYLYHDGTTGYTDLVSMQAALGTREANSLNAKPVFVSNIDLHLAANGNCAFEGMGIPIPGITDDIDDDNRNASTPDIGADEFNGLGGGVGVWAGVNSNWLDPINWCGAIPGITTDVLIPGGLPFYPIITTNTPVTRNIMVQAGGSVQITGAGQLSIYGNMNNAGNFDAADGTIEIAGADAQVIPAGMFAGNDLKNLIVNNNSVSLGGELKLYGKLSFKGSNRTLATNDHLVLRSTASGTAWLADITNNGTNSGNSVSGNVSVERYIFPRRAWRYLSMPTQHNLQTIKESWQENMPDNSTAQSTPAGYGIQLTKDSANATAYGFDLHAGVGPSIKTYVPATNLWKGIAATKFVDGVSTGRFEPGVGYMTIIRGDRTINTFQLTAPPTTLREKGALNLGDVSSIPVPAGLFQGIGNPYACAVDFSKLTRNNLDDVYYMWDPQMGSLGAYVTFSGSSYSPSASISYTTNHFIESGQAFFVKSGGAAGSVTFHENSKVDGSNLVTRQANGNAQKLKTRLYSTVDNEMRLFDGTVHEFGEDYSNGINGLDAIKPTNSGENLGLKVGDQILSVERRQPLSENDTLFFDLTHLRVAGYRFEFVPENLDPMLTGYLVDRYLNTMTMVSMSDTTRIDFSIINNAGSYAANRFYLVFKRSVPVPVTFIDVRAEWRNRDVLVSWDVANEENISHYEVERSGDGSNFGKVHEEAARGVAGYSWLDAHPLGGDNFYRIRGVGAGGDVKYSEIVKVSRDKKAGAIVLYPNPVKEDGVLYLDMQNREAGQYQVQLLNEAGQVVHNQVLNHSGGSSVYSLQLRQVVTHGNYLLKVKKGKDVNLSFKVVY